MRAARALPPRRPRVTSGAPRGMRVGVLVPGARSPPRSRPVAVGDGRGRKEGEVPLAYPLPDREAKAGWDVIRPVRGF